MESKGHGLGKQTSKMITGEGVAKGLQNILLEQGISTTTMHAKDMQVVLSNHDDFANEKNSCGKLSSGKGSPGLLSAQISLRVKHY